MKLINKRLNRIDMRIKLSKLIILAFVSVRSVSFAQQKVEQPVDYVNPYMGNISHLLVPTYPTVH